MTLNIFRNGIPSTTMHTVHSEHDWCKLPLSYEEVAQLLLELHFMLPAEWLKKICVSGI